MSQPTDIEEAAKLLREARERFDKIDEEYRCVRATRTFAINKLNDAQKWFDATVNDIRGDAPIDSDWHSRKGTSV